ncbi:hypothetical protein HAP41_0000048055 (plasmid) [Bradyrhizobium barranii subsp. apii]|uniref:Uncharacterized protein n=1 Tax=Bradyrhizobium barranii subsp. apii TaxID=2819348 RepID=A0A8T5VS12_9BRAD|nr:hypothetical protein [Bradyrhizobium barranii]UPT92296.1 hypothetical protein HAP41_0000048055 [Bradyrhizobium barranii subsp. apii]
MRPGAVNTAFVLDMQRKLHRWSVANAEKVFADLFNIVCDRRTLLESWRRLTRNKGSRTPGTDGVTRKTVEERLGGAVRFIEDIRGELLHVSRDREHGFQGIVSRDFRRS